MINVSIKHKLWDKPLEVPENAPTERRARLKRAVTRAVPRAMLGTGQVWNCKEGNTEKEDFVSCQR